MNNMNAFDSVFITHARKTEQIILGTLLSCLDVRSTVFGMVDVDYFCEPVHRVIYRQMRNFYDANDVIDILTIDHALIGNELYIQSGGLSYLTPLTNGIVEAVFIEKPCLILRQIYILRQAFALGWEIQQKVCNGEDVGDLLKFLNGSFSKLNDLTIWDNASSHISVTVKKALQEAYDRQEARKAGKAIAIGTGLKGLDHLIGGWKKSELVVLAARPSMGKSALMLYFAKMAAKAGNHVCLYSQEMSPVDLVNRLMLSECDVDSTRYRDGNLTDEENKQISRVAGQIERLPIYLNDKPNVSMSYIKEDAKKERSEVSAILLWWIICNFLI